MSPPRDQGKARLDEGKATRVRFQRQRGTGEAEKTDKPCSQVSKVNDLKEVLENTRSSITSG